MDALPYACFENNSPRRVEDLGYFGKQFAFADRSLQFFAKYCINL
jgi:hypothetical protein